MILHTFKISVTPKAKTDLSTNYPFSWYNIDLNISCYLILIQYRGHQSNQAGSLKALGQVVSCVHAQDELLVNITCTCGIKYSCFVWKCQIWFNTKPAFQNRAEYWFIFASLPLPYTFCSIMSSYLFTCKYKSPIWFRAAVILQHCTHNILKQYICI